MSSLYYYKRYGTPESNVKNMATFNMPQKLQVGVIPKRIYCHKQLFEPLCIAFKFLIERGFINELVEWGGCYNVRPIRGYEKIYEALIKKGDIEKAMKYMSVHSWGLAIDLNQSTNRLGFEPTLSDGFVQCFIDAGFRWGGHFKRKDGMHFEI